MHEQRYAFSAGLFILASIGLALGVVFYARGLSLLGPVQRVVAEFGPGADMQGLGVASAVRVHGIAAGSVQAIDLVSDDAGQTRVRVTFAMPAQYILRTGARVVVQAGVTGESLLNVAELGQGEPLSAGATIPGESVGIQTLLAELGQWAPAARQVLARAEEAAVALQQAAGRIEGLAESVQAEVPQVTERYRALTTAGTAAFDQARDLLEDSRTDWRDTLADARAVADTLRERLGPTLDRMDQGLDAVRELMVQARQNMDTVERVLDDGQSITGQVRGLLAENRPKFDRTLTALQRSSESLRAAVGEIRRSPWRLLHRPSARELQNLDVYEAARQFATAAEDLVVAAETLRSAAGHPAIDADRLAELEAALRTRFEAFDGLQDALYTRFRH